MTPSGRWNVRSKIIVSRPRQISKGLNKRSRQAYEQPAEKLFENKLFGKNKSFWVPFFFKKATFFAKNFLMIVRMFSGLIVQTVSKNRACALFQRVSRCSASTKPGLPDNVPTAEVYFRHRDACCQRGVRSTSWCVFH